MSILTNDSYRANIVCRKSVHLTMDITLNPKSLAKLANCSIISRYYRSSASIENLAETSSQNYANSFNTLTVTAPVLIPKPLSNNYWNYKKSLPIYRHKSDFLRALAERQVVVLAAEHHTQRTVQIPQFILEEACERNFRCRIICTQPTQLSTFYSAARVAEERGEYVGGAVGSQIKLKFQYGLTSGLIYCTNDIILNTLMHHDKDYLYNITHIIIDDVHKRDMSCELLLAFLRDHLKTNKNLKVILTTTKSNAGPISSYFDNSLLYLISDRNTNVNPMFLEDVLQMFYPECFLDASFDDDSFFETLMHNCLTSQKDHYFDVLRHLVYADHGYANKQSKSGFTPLTVATLAGKFQLMQLFISLGAEIDGEVWSDRANNNVDVPLITKIIAYFHRSLIGAILVFLPSYEDLVTTKDSLLLSLPMNVDEYEIVIMYEGMDSKLCQKALEVGVNKRKIILATSAVEGGVAIPNVTHVIDTGKVEHSVSAWTKSNLWISQEVATQRANKAGVYSNGVCFHLYTKNFYRSLKKVDGSKIHQVPLHGFCLQTKLLSAPNSSINQFFQLIPKPPLQKNVNQANKDLMILGALNASTELTVLGRLLTQLSIEPRLGKMLVYSVVFKCLDPILTIVACLCYKNPIALPQNVALKDVEPLGEYGGEFLSDHLILIKIYQQWQKLKVKKTAFGNEDQCVNWYAIERIHEIRGELLSQLRGTGFVNIQIMGKTKELNENSDSWAVVKAVLTAGCYTDLFFIDDKSKVSFSKSSALDVLSCRGDDYQLCVVFEDAVKNDSGIHFRFGTVVTPLTVALMYEHANIKYPTGSDVVDHKANIKLFSAMLKKIIYRKIGTPSYEFNQAETEILGLTVYALCSEEAEHNLPQPHGVGTMPRLFINTRAKSTQQQLYELYDRHGFKVDQNDNAQGVSESNQLRGFVSNERLESVNFNSSRTVFFIVKPPSHEYLKRGVTTNNWIFAPKTEKKLFFHLGAKNTVKLFFSVSRSGHFQGVAELVKSNGGNPKQPCQLSWIGIKNVSYETIRMLNLKNTYDDDKLVIKGNDGQEVEYETALQLLNMFL